MLCQGLVVVVQMSDRIYSVLIVLGYYGSPLWKLDSKRVQQFYTTWRKCVRKIWNVPYRTHCNLLRHLYEGPGIEAGPFKMFHGILHQCHK